MTTPPLAAIDLARALPPPPQGSEERRRLAGKSPLEVARELEAVLFAQVIEAMRKSVPESPLGESSSMRMLDGAFDQELAREMLGRDGLGLAQQIAEEAARADARRVRATQAASGTAPPATTTTAGRDGLAAAGVLAREGWVAPVAGRITSGYGVRRDPIAGDERLHEGVDIAAVAGTPVRAVADGQVTFSGPRGAAGNVVEIRHADGVVTSYAHAARTLVTPGQKVEAGDTIATVGATGRATGPHLHFAVRRAGEPRDPTALLPAAAPPAGAADVPEI